MGAGAVYAALGLGVVLTYRGTGVLNFAYGAMAMYPAFVYSELRLRGDVVLPLVIVPSRFHVGAHVSLGVSFVIAVGLGALLGAVSHYLIFRPLRHAPPLAKVVATVGWLLVLQGIVVQRFGTDSRPVAPLLPQDGVHMFGTIVPSDRLYLIAIVVVAAGVLWWIYRFTMFGLATQAAFESERNAALLGFSPDRLAAVSAVVGGVIASVVGILVAPIISLDALSYTLLIVPALAAALVGRLTSFWVTALAGLLLGGLQSELSYVQSQSQWTWLPIGTSSALPFIVIVAAITLFGTSLPLRGALVDGRLPTAIRAARPAVSGSVAVAIGLVLALCLPSGPYQLTFITSLTGILVALSLVVLTGFVGQISLAQMTFAGIGAFTVSRLSTTLGWSFLPSVSGALVAAVGAGVLVGLPALRVRGVNLAVATMGLAVATTQLVFLDPRFTGGEAGVAHVPKLSVFGIGFGSIDDRGLALLYLLVVTLACAGVTAMRRGKLGQRMLAVRANERAAAASGIDVAATKLLGFGISAGLAGLGGVLLAYQFGTVSFDLYDVFVSLSVLAFAYLAGIASVAGAVLAGMIGAGGLAAYALSKAFDYQRHILLVGGIGLILTAIFNPEGIVGKMVMDLRRLRVWLGRRPAFRSSTAAAFTRHLQRARGSRIEDVIAPALQVEAGEVVKVEPVTLEVTDLTVRFGGVVPVQDVALTLGPGEIVGLIGPNGAGKTTLIDTLSGFARPASGDIRLNGESIVDWAPHRRARAKLGRSFQTLELFEGDTVRGNLELAAEDWSPHGLRRVRRAVGRKWWRPGRAALSPLTRAVIQEFDLEADLDKSPSELSFSQRRLVATARAMAAGPSLLMLDEPASGMSDVRRRELGHAIRRLAEDWGIGLLVVDHDMPFVMGLCGRVIVLDSGTKIAEGTPEEIRADPDVIAAYLRGSKSDLLDGGEDGAVRPSMRRVYAGPRADARHLIAARDVTVGYNGQPVVSGLDFEVRSGEIVALLGANRAGKTTTLRSLAGDIHPLAGEVYWLDELVSVRVPLHKRAAQGLGFVTDERSIFAQLTVAENLRLGRCDADRVLALFPELQAQMKRRAGLLSGGQQQMLGLGRALARYPKVLLVDELSLGLAPTIVDRLMDALRQAADEQAVGIVLVEQHVTQALRIADLVCVIAGGKMTLTGTVAQVGDRVADAFLADVLGDGTAPNTRPPVENAERT